ncbi:hypothetical protein BH09DEP1_BH09DEP1_6450 [soil metagenome]
MFKKIFFLLLLPFALQGMLELRQRNVAGVAASAASYYCLAKAIDSKYSFIKKYDAAGNHNNYRYLCAAGGLKALAISLFADNKPIQGKAGSVSSVLQEVGSMYIGGGAYIIETAVAKYKEGSLKEEAQSDCFLGVWLIVYGMIHLPPVFIECD